MCLLLFLLFPLLLLATLYTAVQSYEYLNNVRTRAMQLLASTPNGNAFLQGVLHVLERERKPLLFCGVMSVVVSVGVVAHTEF